MSILKTSKLEKRYQKTAVVDALDLAIAPGDIYGFLGPNGAGKTTTIRMLMGIIAADSGTIELFGKTRRRPTNEDKRQIGYVSQDQHFYPWMSGDDLARFVGAFYPTWDRGEFDRLTRRLELPVDRKASQLSRGMQVKLALALALAHRPALLILDEPTSGLDPLTRREFLDLIRAQAKSDGRTTFFSSHIIEDLEGTANRIGILKNGRLLYQGAPETLCREIRRVPNAPELGVPEGFTVIGADERGTLLRAPEALWPVDVGEPLELEAAFVALVRSTSRPS
ncbi:MAG: ABC transporter ATP-binding protein [Deltaproteobacteria bacterium]|nr:ABC transporter ATP-binding protein [Deltaproteobacteria bacterium]